MMILCSTIGGHRGTLVVLSEGFNSDIPCKVTYIGTLDIETVHGRCALIHHIDCNKRVNQGAEDRISSGVEANDLEFIEVMKDLLTCKLYVDKHKNLHSYTELEGFNHDAFYIHKKDHDIYKERYKMNDSNKIRYQIHFCFF